MTQKNILNTGFYDLVFIDTKIKENKIQFQFILKDNRKVWIFRTFTTLGTPTSLLAQFIKMLCGNNNIILSNKTLPNVVAKIKEMKGSLYRAYITPNKSLTWNNLVNIQLLEKVKIKEVA